MGWASGSSLAESLWNRVRKYIPEKDREEVANLFVSEFRSFDCDTLDEAETLWLDSGRTYD